MNVPILFENEEYLILNKPAGLLVHGRPIILPSDLELWLMLVAQAVI